MLFDCGKTRILFSDISFNIFNFGILLFDQLALFLQMICNLQIGSDLVLVYCVVLKHVVFQNLIRPTTESYARFTIDAIANRYNHIKVIEIYASCDVPLSFFSNYSNFSSS